MSDTTVEVLRKEYGEELADKFLSNLERVQKGALVEGYKGSFGLLAAYHWRVSPEGHHYWSEIHKQLIARGY